MLSYPDSNQDKQNQNLLCYHYTIGQSSLLSFEERCKGSAFERKCQTFKVVFDYGVDWGCLPVGFCVLFGFVHPLSVEAVHALNYFGDIVVVHCLVAW